MAFNKKEEEIIRWSLSNGKKPEEIKQAIINFRTTGSPRGVEKPVEDKSLLDRVLLDVPEDIKTGLETSGEQFMEAGKNILDTASNDGLTFGEKARSIGAEAFKRGGRFIGEVFGTASKLPVTPEFEEKAGKLVGDVGEVVAKTELAQNLINQYNSLDEEQKREIDNVLGFAEGLGAIGTAGLVTKVSKPVLNEALNLAQKGLGEVGKVSIAVPKVAVPEVATGLVQTGKEFAERLPRAVSNIKETAEEATLRANRIKQSTPQVAEAIKKGVDDKFINAVVQADTPTRQAYKKVLDIAEETPKIGGKQQPTIIGGELATKQFDLINKQKKAIGQKIGDTVKELSKTTKVNINESVRIVDDILANQGIGIEYTKKGPKLSFTGTKYTPAERTKIQELYNLATEGGSELTPQQIYLKDQLFSKLQRESKFEGVGDLMVNTPDGDSSLFRVFRDIYSKNLDDVSPEIRVLNKEYRNVATLVDDLEDSIFKTPNFNITKTADPAEFAKVNLRRIFGESQSSPAFEAVADKMDEFARSLGYSDAKPKDVASFAQELRELYPDTIPSAGFSGGIKMGLTDILEKVSKVGEIKPKDRQKALRSLIESLIKT